MIVGTILQAVIYSTSAATSIKNFGILTVAIVEVALSAAFFMNLRYEPKILALFPILAILAVAVFITAATLAVGM